MGLTEKTFAVVVAIEQYARLGAGWSLGGVGAQAAQFTAWLVRERKLPPENVQIFASGCPAQAFTELGISRAQIQEATSTNINQFFAGLAETWSGGEVLWLYWVGHGFVSRESERRLILADASAGLKTNLDVNQLIRLLRSSQAGNFRRQYAVIDSCAQFFEELQSPSGLPPGGLNPGNPRGGVEQYFYFAASSGEYATNRVFGPRVLDLLRSAAPDIWPPDPRWMRNAIEDLFSKLGAEREADQQPAWFEYRDGLDNRLVHGVLPTLNDIHEVAKRTHLSIRQLRELTKLAIACQSLATIEARDDLDARVGAQRPIYRPVSARSDQALDLLRLIAGAIEQNRGAELAAGLVAIDSNSDAAVHFEVSVRRVEIIRKFWYLLANTPLRLDRARVLFHATNRFWAGDTEPESMEEIVDILVEQETGSALVEFLWRAAQDQTGNPRCQALATWLEAQAEWTETLARVKKLVENETSCRRYLLVQAELESGVCRVAQAWIWDEGDAAPRLLEDLDEHEAFGKDLAKLLAEARAEGRTVHVEILAPESLLHLAPEDLSWTDRRHQLRILDHPVALRWSERMKAPLRDLDYQRAEWNRAGLEIEKRVASMQAHASWVASCCDTSTLLDARAGDLIGIEPASAGGGLEEIVVLICEGGLPYACWPRSSAVDLTAAKPELERMMREKHFKEIPFVRKEYALADILLLWDDPRRNPYDEKFRFREVVQR